MDSWIFNHTWLWNDFLQFRQGSKLCDGILCVWRFHRTLQSVQQKTQMTFHCLFKLTHGPLGAIIQMLVQVPFDKKHESQNTPNDSAISSLQWVPTLFCVDLNLFLHTGLAEAIIPPGIPSLVRPQIPVLWQLLEFCQAMLQLFDLSLGIDLRALLRVVLPFLQAGLGRESIFRVMQTGNILRKLQHPPRICWKFLRIRQVVKRPVSSQYIQ